MKAVFDEATAVVFELDLQNPDVIDRLMRCKNLDGDKRLDELIPTEIYGSLKACFFLFFHLITILPPTTSIFNFIDFSMSNQTLFELTSNLFLAFYPYNFLRKKIGVKSGDVSQINLPARLVKRRLASRFASFTPLCLAFASSVQRWRFCLNWRISNNFQKYKFICFKSEKKRRRERNKL